MFEDIERVSVDPFVNCPAVAKSLDADLWILAVAEVVFAKVIVKDDFGSLQGDEESEPFLPPVDPVIDETDPTTGIAVHIAQNCIFAVGVMVPPFATRVASPPNCGVLHVEKLNPVLVPGEGAVCVRPLALVVVPPPVPPSALQVMLQFNVVSVHCANKLSAAFDV